MSRIFTSYSAPTFTARFRNLGPSNPQQAVASGMSTALGGAYTLGNEAAAASHGAPISPVGLLIGAFNSWMGYSTIRDNGGVKNIKDPD